jgi:hypothetical protein
MKVAYLILAHHQPVHLARLVERINAHWADIFIHIDRKVVLDDFRRAVNCANSRVTFLEGAQRVKVSWGGFSMVRATLNLLEAALRCSEPYDRFCLLSGADFPIKNNAAIYEQFCSNTEFMRIDRKVGYGETTSHSGNISRLWFFDEPYPIRKLLSGRFHRRPYQKLTFYHGSSWWCLTRACVEQIMHYLEENPDFALFHSRVLSPDEIFFHTLVKNLPFADRINHDFARSAGNAPQMPNEHGCHYIDWGDKPAASPKILDLDDYDRLVNSPALFARKFDEKFSRSLLEKLQGNYIKMTTKT